MKKQLGKIRAWCIRKLGGYSYELPKEPSVTRYTMPVEKICSVVRLSGFEAANRNEEWMKNVIKGQIVHGIGAELVKRGIVKVTEHQTDMGVNVIGTLIVGVPGEDGDA